MKAISTNKLTKKYKDKIAVDELDLSVEEGELFALLGINGAGKTTTIKMLSCLIQPTSGDAQLLGNSILTDSMTIKEAINVSPQETAIARNLTVRENLEFMAGIYHHNSSEAKAKTQEMLDMFKLQEVAKNRAKTLSGGMQRRLSIAMALISNPKILFLDEPTLGLDVIARRELWSAIENLKKQMTIVLTTHYMEEVEALADRVGVMAEGKLKACGTVEELKTKVGAKSLEEAFVTLATGEGAAL